MSKSVANALHLPHMRANPFSPRPIESSDYALLVGRTELMSNLRHHLRFGSPRLMILLGERGTGRTSVLQTLGNLSPTPYSFSYYPEGETSNILLHELYCLIVGYDVPPSTNPLVEEMVASLEGKSGDLPLISFDFPNVGGADLAQVFERLTSVLRRLRALVIVALTPAQLSAWPDDLQNEYDITEPLEDFNSASIRALIDKRISQVSNEGWSAPQSVIEDTIAHTGGRPLQVVKHFRDLIDAEKGASTAFSRKQEMIQSMDLEPNDAKNRMASQVEPLESLVDESEEMTPPIEDLEAEVQHEPEDDFHWDVSEIKPELEEDFLEEPVEEPVNDGEGTSPEFELPSLEVDQTDEPDLSKALGGAVLQMEPGTEPPPPVSAFGGLTDRQRTAKVEIGLDNALRPKASGPMTAKPDTSMHFSPEEPEIDSMETTYWVADSLPEPQPEPEPEPAPVQTPVMDPLAAKSIGENLRKDKPKPAASTFPLDFEKVSSLNDSEISIVEASIAREVSPSDAALQAYLAVGRPRLSQIFNGLHKAGILSVRKKGRTRLFRISDQAKAHFTDGHMEV